MPFYAILRCYAQKDFNKVKEEYLWRKVNPEKIRPEDMRDEEYLWYTIRKQWREEQERINKMH